MSEAARQLELALANDGPVDAGLRARLFARAEAALTVLAGLEIPALEAASVEGAEPGCGDRRQRIQELTALLEAGNTRALDHLPWLERCLGAEASGEGMELVRQIEALDFPAALEILHGLGEGAFAGPR